MRPTARAYAPTRVGAATQPRTDGPIPGLLGLRAIACMAVFLVHFQQQTQVDGSIGFFELGRFLENGNTGVALFFSLSGFLLSIPFWRNLMLQEPFPSLSAFWLKRLARILPAYFLCLTGLVLLNRQWQEPRGAMDILLHYTLTFNFREASIFTINPPFWTLAVESQFYLLLPLLFLLLRWARPTTAVVVLLCLCAAAYFGHLSVVTAWDRMSTLPPSANPVLHYSLLAHLPHFLLGVAVVPLYFHVSKADRAYASWVQPASELVVWLASFAAVVILATDLDDLLQVPGGRYNFPVVPLLLVAILCFVPFSVVAKALLESFPWRALGTISYGIYLYHLPVQHATARYMTKVLALDARSHWLMFGFASLALTVLVASLSFIIVERPILSLVRRNPEPSRKRSSEVDAGALLTDPSRQVEAHARSNRPGE